MRPVRLCKPFALCPFPYLTFIFFFFCKSTTLSMRYSHLALGDFDFSQYQLHKIISTITTTSESARKDAAQEEKKINKKRFLQAFRGLV